VIASKTKAVIGRTNIFMQQYPKSSFVRELTFDRFLTASYGGVSVRVDLTNFRRTTLDRVREAVEATGQNWAGQWTVRIFAVDETLL
jgi:hypothetical protein